MTSDMFTGSLVRLCIFDTERDTELLSRWDRNSEYQQLLNSDPAYLWTPKQLREFLEKDSEDRYLFAIHTLTDDRAVGFIEISISDWTARNGWVGIGIGEREDWGKGYGTDAMKLLLQYAFGELNLTRVSLSVFEYNPRGMRSYEKCGFHVEGRLRQYLCRGGERYDMIFMGILREAWEAQQSSEIRTEVE